MVFTKEQRIINNVLGSTKAEREAIMTNAPENKFELPNYSVVKAAPASYRNPFDQNLNTTNDVTFQSVIGTGGVTTYGIVTGTNLSSGCTGYLNTASGHGIYGLKGTSGSMGGFIGDGSNYLNLCDGTYSISSTGTTAFQNFGLKQAGSGADNFGSVTLSLGVGTVTTSAYSNTRGDIVLITPAPNINSADVFAVYRDTMSPPNDDTFDIRAYTPASNPASVNSNNADTVYWFVIQKRN